MSKYEPLWGSFKSRTEAEIQLSFDEIKEILGFPIDHAFLSSKKELKKYGYEVKKISLKGKMVLFRKI